ncbi:MAG: ribonuclease T [Arsenophonus sp.]|nr:MAG: ribonuclease T [Arsenophonus sp.]
MSDKIKYIDTIAARFRNYYPVVIDVETGGFNSTNDAILEIAAITLKMDKEGWLKLDETMHYHIVPFKGANIEKSSLAFTGIKLKKSLKNAVDEYTALNLIFNKIREGIKNNHCSKAIIVAHNAFFDLSFILAAVERTKIKKNPFHPFVTFDTAALSGLVFGQTILSKACYAAKITFNQKYAHRALYDTDRTAVLFCKIVNKWKKLGGWPIVMN